MKVEYINPFVEASISVLKSCCKITAKIGKLSIKPLDFKGNHNVILIGVTGQVKGQVFIDFKDSVAKLIVGSMVGFDVQEVDDLAESALAELGNMIMGNTATIF